MRLIDADDFKKFLQALCKAGAPYEEVIQLLDKQPTAYDVDAVVKELEEEVKKSTISGMGGISCNIDETKIIDIVKKGGVK